MQSLENPMVLTALVLGSAVGFTTGQDIAGWVYTITACLFAMVSIGRQLDKPPKREKSH